MVRAKFKVASIKRSEGSKDKLDAEGRPEKDAKGYVVRVPCEMVSIEAYAVYGNGDPTHENTKFWQASPSGKLTLDCVNEAASSQFKVGQEFHLDMTPVS